MALDFDNIKAAQNIVDRLDPNRCALKVGKEMYTRFGPKWVNTLVDKGFKVFLDLKFHDIPNTVARACKAAADLGVWMVNVHALGGLAMMHAAREAIGNGPQAPRLIAVTLLTSHDEQWLSELGLMGSLQDNVMHLARLSHKAGMDGIVCSAMEAPAIRQALGKDFLIVSPGIRLPENKADDQKRIMTPKQAIENGVDCLVIGRPITQASSPAVVLNAILESL